MNLGLEFNLKLGQTELDMSKAVSSKTKHAHLGLVRGFRRSRAFGVVILSLFLASSFSREAAAVDANFTLAVSRTLSGKHNEAQALADRLSDPVQRKVVEWLFVQSGSPDVGYNRIIAFLRNNPTWPQRDLITKRLEKAFYDGNPSASVLQDYFSTAKPIGYAGMLSLARLYVLEGNRSEAARWAGKAWRETDFSAESEKRVLAEFGSLISSADHRRRLVQQIYDQNTAAAARTAARISTDHVRMVQAAKALFAESSGGLKLLNSLPASLRNQPVMLYPLVRYYRRAGQEAQARAIASTINPAPGEMDDPYAWWVEKRMLARQALTPNSPKAWAEAYTLVRSHGYNEGSGLDEGEFLAGWIALRYLNDPQKALVHFQQLRRVVTSQEKVAQAEYWLGRTRMVLGDGRAAQAHFSTAARYQYTFYGLLSRDQIGLSGKQLPVGGTPEVSDKLIASVSRSNELLAAAQLLAGAGQQRLLSQFFVAAARHSKSADEAATVATVAWRLKAPNLALRSARTAATKGFDLGAFAYPVNAVPSFKPIKTVDPALMYGVIRQESEFNPVAVSGAGARGLMQIMPDTARLVARQHRQPFQPAKLTDPTYSLALGTAHLSDLVDGFGGSYIMTLVAYNAGPRRVSEWNSRFGDPRKGQIDPIDWIESIPFAETREYVQKIMANVIVYRARLTPKQVMGMTSEISRGGTARTSRSSSPENIASTEDRCSGASTIERLISSCN
ncbi:soluble lytic murein transglycosylase [Rhodoligotrophos appendicifer]|uniref:lytic transglycosylase domain-containing protein n=1 Tax=Rhodoligotrophos appendicifer TaxID=987056 RepID=UPI0011855683|nr:lytic transglycosylase domain-containing protein [Rhodoligotrophos appendicifer]